VAQEVTYERLARGMVGSPFLQALEIPSAAKRLRNATEAAPGMLSFGERAMLLEILRTTWRGDGAVIDGGSFFGSSLAAAAEGMLAGNALEDVEGGRFPQQKPIHAYELGYLPAPTNGAEQRRTFGGVEYRWGDSFVPILEATAAPYRDLVSLHIGDLLEETWDGSPIEIAFIDVCKTKRLNAHVSREFYPSLIPAGSTLIHRDFFFDRMPWLKVTMSYLRDYFRWEGQIFSSSVYRNVAAVPHDVAAIDPFQIGTYEECLELHDDWQYPGIERQYEFLLSLSRAYLAALKDRKDDALDMLRAVENTYPDLLGDADNPRGNQFRFDRAIRQITRGDISKVS
jgi:hypothetical protein